MESDIQQEFNRSCFTFDGEASLMKCFRIAEMHRLNPVELSENFEVFAIQRDLGTKHISEQLMDAFALYLEKVKGKENEKKHAYMQGSGRASAGGANELDLSFMGSPLSMTPKKRKHMAASSSGEHIASPMLSPGASFQNRQERGKVLLVLNNHLLGGSPMQLDSEKSDIDVRLVNSQWSSEQKFIGDTIASKVTVIEAKIVDFISRLKDCTSIEATEPVTMPTQDPVWVAGRICCDADARLNEHSILLEGSMQFSGGSRVKLDVSRMADYSLFPGQIVAVQGLNPTGSKLLALAIIGHLPRPFQSPPTGAPQRLKVLVAAGPFTTSEDFSYSPLKELAEVCKKESPEAVILLGPFIDADHPNIASLEVPFEALYHDQVLPLIKELQEVCPLVLAMPSIRDAHCFPVFPQPPLLVIPENGISAPNPSVIRFGDCTFGACSQDVIKHMSMAVSERVPQSTDRMGRLWQHILGQGSFYPLYPAPLGTCLDSSLNSYIEMAETPDVLIAASDLAPMAKIVGLPFPRYDTEKLSIHVAERKVVCINPGRLSKGHGGGTYAMISIAGLSPTPYDASDRCAVSICKI